MGVLIIGSTYAHDPSKHTSKSEKPKCETMKNMDYSEMDMNDPVMQAIIKKCQPVQYDQGQDDQHKDHQNNAGVENKHQNELDHKKQDDDYGHH